MDHVTSLKCLICGREYRPDEIEYVCPKHGDEGIVDVQYDYDLIGRRISPATLAANPNPTIWRYRPLLPIEPDSLVPPLTVGGTPLYRADRLAAGLGLQHVWVKDEGREPSASFKDRASAIAVVKAQERGAEIITTSSTGNAGAALSALCASVGQKNVIFVPESAPPAKITQLLVYGSTVILVRGAYDDAFELCAQAAKEFGWYNRNTGYNPYMTEGKKTAAYEICEQLTFTPGPSPFEGEGGMWNAPDRIFVPVGDGCIIGGIHKGLKDLLALGWITEMPKLMGVQAAGSAALYEAWRTGMAAMQMTPIDAQTIADSISAGLPADRIKGLAAVRETGGVYIKVTDDEILAAIPALARGSGVFAEPAAAAAYAGLVKAVEQGLVHPDERIIVLSTGNGLKDIASARKSVGEPMVVDKDLAAVKRALSK
ncbi:MAG: threonine synthase [Chloroflexi bacterium HGW-Chloroflexi-1]|nr:MAG: threonine synthase [Chloroflexi bacterium HGW-Chloroflexi-1]